MIRALTAWLKHRRERAELNALDADERDRLASDLGVSASELDYLVSESHDPVELPRMMAAIGIGEAALRRAQPALMREMERACSLCRSADLCSEELANGTAGVSYPYFCPNGECLKEVSAESALRREAGAA